MDEKTKTLVQDSFAKILPTSEAAASLFYGRLFEIDPDVEPLFASTDMTLQGRKLMDMIDAAVSGLDDLEALTPVVQDLGVRHAAYGVTPAHYDSVGAALLWTLGRGLGEDFTPELEAAWTEVYTLLSSVMKEAAYN